MEHVERAEYINRIVVLMNENELSQDAFAASIGLNRDRVNNWLNGRSKLDIDSLAKISRQYGVSSDWILGLKPIDARSPDSSIQGVAAVTGLSEKAIDNLIREFKVKMSPELQAERGMESASKLSALLESEKFADIVYSIEEYCCIRNICNYTLKELSGLENDRINLFYDDSDLMILETLFPEKEKDKIKENALLNIKQYVPELRMRKYEFMEQWYDFLESFIPSKDLLADALELYKKYKL